MVHENESSATAALDLARRGFAVFTCHYVKPDGSCSCGESNCGNVGKHPMTASGFKDASTDPAAVERMFRGSRSQANIGVATGPVSGIWVLDVEAAGLPILDQLQQQHGTLPTTVSSITGGGGKHLWFRWNGIEVRNRAKINKTPIDCRGAGGYVVVPPSSHKSGRRYRWEHDPETTTIVEAPSWLTDYVVGTSTKPAEPIVTMPAAAGSLVFTVAEPVEDLATVPGASEGQRHDTATRLIGGAIGRGTDPVEVARQAVEWGRRCTPPMSDDEVLRIVGDFARKQISKIAAVEEQVEAVPLPEPAPWPILDGDAYVGLTGEIVKTITPESEADPVAILAQLLVSFGNLIGRDAHYIVEGTRHHANLFAVLVGSTARGRKGTSEGRVRQVLRFADEQWVLGNIATGLVSGEGIVWAVRDQIIRREAVYEGKGKDKRIVGYNEVVADEGIDDKRLLVVEPEFAAVLRVCRREQNTLSATLRSAWDSGILRTLAKNSPARATDAHISVIGHITREELRRALAEVDGFNGFANRFLWLAVRRSKLLPDGGKDLDLTRHAQRLALAAEQARSVERMQRDQAAAALWRQVYGELADDQTSGLLGAITSRAEAQVLRLSMVYALLDGSGTITERHLRAALAVWRFCRSSAAMIFGGMGADPVEEQVLAAIKQAPGISRKDLHRALGNHVKATVLVSILARLRDAGRVRIEKVPGAGTKPAERWFPCEQRELANLQPQKGREQGKKFASSQSSQEQPDNGTGTGTGAVMEVVVL